MASAKILSTKDIRGMRAVGRLAADTLCYVGESLTAGMTTDDINTLVHEYTLERKARPAPLNYKGFPKSVCTSVNHVVCHGIPGPQKLREGDIINVDVTSVLPARAGWFGDTSATFYIGKPSPLARHVVEVARKSLELGMAVVRPGARIGDIGYAIQTFAESKGCSVVRTYTGHGIHRVFHDNPSVPHYGRKGTGPLIRKGMCFTIEPMINLGHYAVDHLDDDWTVVTEDGSLSAQFEHTILVTHKGIEVLTRRDRPLQHSEDKPWTDLGELSCFIPPVASEE
jgi:methionyl aminopeptidase